MKKLLALCCLFIGCGSPDRYQGHVEYDLYNLGLDEHKIGQYVRLAISDFQDIEDFNPNLLKKHNLTIEYHDNDPWLCSQFKSGTCITEGTNHSFYVEIDINRSPYSATYHEFMHYLLNIHQIGETQLEQHQWMRDHHVCSNLQHLFGTHCADVSFKL